MKKITFKSLVILLSLVLILRVSNSSATPLQTIIYPDKNICQGSVTTLDAGCAFTSFLWNTGATTQTITASAGTYSVIVTDANGFSYTLQYQINFLAGPSINLGADISICQGQTATLNPGSGFTSYLWSTTATTSSIVVGTSGTYSVIVTDNNGCTGSDQINIIVNPLPVVNLGPDVFVCNGNSALLDAGVGFASYQWSNLATTQTIDAGLGNYSVTVTDNNGCVGTDNISVLVSPYCSSVPCGNTTANPAFNGHLDATLNSNATHYRFRFYELSDPINPIGELMTPPSGHPINQCWFQYVTIPGGGAFPLVFNHTYNWTVEIEYLTSTPGIYAWGPPSNHSCTLTFPPPTGISICSLSTTLNNHISVQGFLGSSSGYRFRFYEPGDLTHTIQGERIQSSNTIYFSNVSPSLLNNHVYNWTVEVEYNTTFPATTKIYGPASNECPITFGTPGHAPQINFSTNQTTENNNEIKDNATLNTIVANVKEPNLNVFPNPSIAGSISLEITGIESLNNVSYNIYDSLGKLVYTKSNSGKSEIVNTGNLKPGVYLVKATVDGKQMSQHFVIK
jgi:hypothetical protein